MKILLVNDDGIQSPLLSLLVRSGAARGHAMRVCAPATQQSGKAHSLTFATPLMAHPVEMEYTDGAIAVDGTPGDCTRVGLTLWPDTQLVISGMNMGWNAGLSVYVSGTVGAAREAAFRGIKAMAVSREVHTPDATTAFFADWCIQVAEHLLDYSVPKAAVCNLNAPDAEISELKPAVLCDIDTTPYNDELEERYNPRHDRYFWTVPDIMCDNVVPGSDLDYLKKGHFTCTFLTPTPCEQSRFTDFLETL